MRLMTFLKSLVHSAPKATTSAPGQGGRAHVAGQAVLNQLDAQPSLREARAREIVCGNDRAALAVNPHTRVAARPDASPASTPLDANWVTPGVMVLSAPHGRRDIEAWARTCEGQNITHVVDIGTRDGEAPAWLSSTAPWPSSRASEGGSRSFASMNGALSASKKRDLNLEQRLGSGALERRVVLKHPAPARDPKALPHAVTWTRVPLQPGAAPSPQLLLAVCRQIDSHGAGADLPGRVAFHDSNGGNSTAVFAAALRMFREYRTDYWTRECVPGRVLESCLALRENRSTSLFTGRPDLVGALLDFGALLMKQGAEYLPHVVVSDHRAPELAKRAARADDRDMRSPALAPQPKRPVLQPALRSPTSMPSWQRDPPRDARRPMGGKVQFRSEAEEAQFTDGSPTAKSILSLCSVPVVEVGTPVAKISKERRAELKTRDLPWDDQPSAGSDIASSR